MEKFEFRIHGGKVCCETVRDATGAIDFTRLCADCQTVARRAGLKALASSGSPAVRSGTAPAKMRAACEQPHTLGQQVSREASILTIERVWGSQIAGLMDLENATCDQLRRWSAAARKEEGEVAALRAAASLPPSVRAAVDAGNADLRGAEAIYGSRERAERSMIGRLAVGRVMRAALEAEPPEDREARLRTARRDAIAQSAVEDIASGVPFAQQLGVARLRRLAAEPESERDELVSAIRSSALGQHFTQADLEAAPVATLRDLAAKKDHPSPGHSVGLARDSIRQARADADRAARRSGKPTLPDPLGLGASYYEP